MATHQALLQVVCLCVAVTGCRERPSNPKGTPPAAPSSAPAASSAAPDQPKPDTAKQAPSEASRRPIQVVAAADHTHVLMSDGTVHAMGANEFGALGLPKGTKSVARLTAITGLVGVKQIATGTWHGCALVEGGKAKCWGRNFGGALGNGSSNGEYFVEPGDVVGLLGVAEVGAAGNHSCARLASGTVSCWGCVISGTVARPEALPQPAKATTLALGSDSSCALLEDQSVSCWDVVIGKEFDYGDAVNDGDGNVKKPARVPGLKAVRALSVSSTHACAVTDSGKVYCWGHGSTGQLGTGGSGESYKLLRPTAVPNIEDAITVSAGAGHTCVVHREGKLSCFGQNGHGQLGLGDRRLRTKPEEVSAVRDVTMVSAGTEHTCALTSAGAVYCWGRNHRGQVGQEPKGLADSRPQPQAVALEGT